MDHACGEICAYNTVLIVLAKKSFEIVKIEESISELNTLSGGEIQCVIVLCKVFQLKLNSWLHTFVITWKKYYLYNKVNAFYGWYA